MTDNTSKTKARTVEAPAVEERWDTQPTDKQATTVPGMGAIALKQGFAFRVWAPNAQRVAVVGSFNNWQETDFLSSEPGGTWFGKLPTAKVGDEYRFLIFNGDQKLSRIDPRALKVTNSVGNAVIWQPEAKVTSFKAPTLNQMVVYELHIGSFNPLEDGKPGTFDSAILRLDYLKDLGINVIELMPVSEFAGDFSWGYNPAHPFAVESAYGGPEGLQRFIAAAHERGIAVVIDVVFNHFGPGDLGLWQFDGWSENGLGGIYFYNDWRANTPWGDSRPDYGRGEVRSYIHDNAVMWLEKFGADGLRWDMTVYVRSYKGRPEEPSDDLKEGWGMCQWINAELAAKFPQAIRIAEDLRDSEWLVKKPEDAGAGFSTQWDAAFVHPVRNQLSIANDDYRDVAAIAGAVTRCYVGDAFARVIYTESHDEVANGKARLTSEINPTDPGGYYAKKRALLGASLVLTSPGIPMFFQGQEFLENEWFRDEVPLDWQKLEKYPGIHRAYKQLVALRKNNDGVSGGLQGQHCQVFHQNPDSKIIAFSRSQDNQEGLVLVIANLSVKAFDQYTLGAPVAGEWQVLINTDDKTYSDDFGALQLPELVSTREQGRDGFEFSLELPIGPYATIILRRKP